MGSKKNNTFFSKSSLKRQLEWGVILPHTIKIDQVMPKLPQIAFWAHYVPVSAALL